MSLDTSEDTPLDKSEAEIFYEIQWHLDANVFYLQNTCGRTAGRITYTGQNTSSYTTRYSSYLPRYVRTYNKIPKDITATNEKFNQCFTTITILVFLQPHIEDDFR